MKTTIGPQEVARLRVCRTDHDTASADPAQRERVGEASDLARQFARTLRAMQASDWLELGQVF